MFADADESGDDQPGGVPVWAPPPSRKNGLGRLSGRGLREDHQATGYPRSLVQQAKQAGIRVSGPRPADTLFGAAVRGDYDVIVAMYHDQGLIPLKTIAFGECINMTIGLPIIRTSVDHGTAYDIAGKGRADPKSLIQAITLASQLARKQ